MKYYLFTQETARELGWNGKRFTRRPSKEDALAICLSLGGAQKLIDSAFDVVLREDEIEVVS